MNPVFQIGDRVRSIDDYCGETDTLTVGDEGVICRFGPAGYDYGIRWDRELPDGHDCAGTCEYGHGRYVYADTIELVDNGPLVELVIEEDLL